MGWKGFNCTIPHKEAVIAHLDALSPAAELIGAVNCVVNQEGRLLGENTDGKGFLQSVETVRPVAGIRAVILGAGGAARAIAVELALSGAAHLTIVNRTPHRGALLAETIRERTGVPAQSVPWDGVYAVPEDVRLVVNATSIGLYPDVRAEVPLDVETLRPGQLVCDIIPNPPQTRLVEVARQRGCHVLDGLGMLVNQGVIGVRLWTGRNPEPAVMRDALEAVFRA